MVSTIFLQLSNLKLSSSKYMLDQLECMMAFRIISWSIIACHVFTLTKSQIHYTACSQVSFINVFFSAVLIICSRIFIHKIFFLHQIAFIVILQIQLERDTWDTDRKTQTWHFWHVVWPCESSLTPFCVEFICFPFACAGSIRLPTRVQSHAWG